MRFALTVSLLVLSVAPARPAQQDAPVADHHQHLFSPALAALISPAPPAPPTAPIDAAQLIALLDEAGIRRAVLLSMGYSWGNPARKVENVYEKVRAENDWTAEQAARFPGRLVAFCSVNPLADYALAELDRCSQDPRLRNGLKLHIGNSAVNYRDPQHVERLRRIFAAANGHRMPIVVHMRASISQKMPYGRDEARTFFEEVIAAAPDVVIQIAHLATAGGYPAGVEDQALSVFIEAIEKQDTRAKNLYFDVTTVAQPTDTPEIRALIATRIRQLGLQRILYGSDAASGGNLAPRDAWALFRRLPLTEAEFDTIAGNVAPYLVGP